MVWQLAAADPRLGDRRMALELSLSVCDYDRTAAIFDGRAPIEGCDVTAVANSPEESFHRAFKFQEFDVTEISMSSYLLSRGAQRLALRRDSGLRVAAVPALQHLHPHRPRHQDAGRPQGQDHRPAGIPDDRERLGARHAGGGIRRQAARHQMAARRTGGAGPRGARQDQRCRRRSTCSRCRTTAPSPTCWRRARSTAC